MKKHSLGKNANRDLQECMANWCAQFTCQIFDKMKPLSYYEISIGDCNEIAFETRPPGCLHSLARRLRYHHRSTNQSIAVTTPGVSGASCILSVPGMAYNINSTPGTVTVKKSAHNIAVLCKKDGYEDGHARVRSVFQSIKLGYFLAAGAMGASIDARSGARFKYPNKVEVYMRKETAPSAPVSSSSSDSSVPTS